LLSAKAQAIGKLSGADSAGIFAALKRIENIGHGDFNNLPDDNGNLKPGITLARAANGEVTAKFPDGHAETIKIGEMPVILANVGYGLAFIHDLHSGAAYDERGITGEFKPINYNFYAQTFSVI
jgi:hypothetical protein